MPMVEPNRIAAQQPPHPRDQVGVGRLHHQVKMVAHQTVGMHLKTGLLAGFRQRLEKILSVHVIQVNGLLTIPTAHDVVKSPQDIRLEVGAAQSPLCQPGIPCQ